VVRPSLKSLRMSPMLIGVSLVHRAGLALAGPGIAGSGEFWSLVMVVSLMVRVMVVTSGCGSWFGFQIGFRFSGASGFHDFGQRRLF
jgi:hypothetical protein